MNIPIEDLKVALGATILSASDIPKKLFVYVDITSAITIPTTYLSDIQSKSGTFRILVDKQRTRLLEDFRRQYNPDTSLGTIFRNKLMVPLGSSTFSYKSATFDAFRSRLGNTPAIQDCVSVEDNPARSVCEATSSSQAQRDKGSPPAKSNPVSTRERPTKTRALPVTSSELSSQMAEHETVTKPRSNEKKERLIDTKPAGVQTRITTTVTRSSDVESKPVPATQSEAENVIPKPSDVPESKSITIVRKQYRQSLGLPKTRENVSKSRSADSAMSGPDLEPTVQSQPVTKPISTQSMPVPTTTDFAPIPKESCKPLTMATKEVYILFNYEVSAQARQTSSTNLRANVCISPAYHGPTTAQLPVAEPWAAHCTSRATAGAREPDGSEAKPGRDAGLM